MAQRKRAFTLIELLVVIAIIALLVSILVPSLSAARDMARKVPCQMNLKDMGLGFAMYANANSDIIVPIKLVQHPADPNLGQFSWLSWWWADCIGPFYDAGCKAALIQGDLASVGDQRTDGNYFAYQQSNGIVCSKRMGCPSQRNTPPDGYEYHYRMTGALNGTASALTWARTTLEPTGWAGIGGWADAAPIRKLSSYYQPSNFAMIIDGDGDTANSSWRFANLAAHKSIPWSPWPNLILMAPHRKTINVMMLDGHVTNYDTGFLNTYYNDENARQPFDMPAGAMN